MAGLQEKNVQLFCPQPIGRGDEVCGRPLDSEGNCSVHGPVSQAWIDLQRQRPGIGKDWRTNLAAK